MTQFKTILGTLALCSAISTTALAGGGTVRSDLPEQVQQMHCLVGEWRGKATMKMGGNALELDVSLSCSEASGGWGVLCKSRFSGMPEGTVEETDLFGYDPHSDTYHWFSVTSMGDTHDHVAEVPKGPTVRWVYQGTMEDKPFTETIEFTFNKKGNRITFGNSGTLDGQEIFTLDGKLRKK